MSNGTLINLSTAIFRSFEDGFLQHQARTIDPAGFASDAATLRFIFTQREYRALWRTLRIRFGGDFQAYMAEEAAAP